MPPFVSLRDRIEHSSLATRLGLGSLLLASGVLADVVTGPSFSVLPLYIVAVMFAAWQGGGGFATLACLASAAGVLFAARPWDPGFAGSDAAYWNAIVRGGSLAIVAWLVLGRRADFDRLRREAAEDATALRTEVSFNDALRDELAVREAEQRRIGRDLHDGLSQHLTATLLASKVLEEKLAARSLAEAADARYIAHLLGRGIGQVQHLARGLNPAEIVPTGLAGALRDLADATRRLSGIECSFTAEPADFRCDEFTATHLYRIAQEAVNNALRHATPSRILVRLATAGSSVELRVADDGAGMPPGTPLTPGLGYRTMRERARLIGGVLETTPVAGGGTCVVCTLPDPTHGGRSTAAPVAFAPAHSG